jgi:molecular chaperone HtpG
MAKHQFQTEAEQILQLMTHSLYSNKEIFLRELISNASDALDKLNMLVLTDEKYKDVTFSPRIDIVANKDAKTLTIKDSGIGMNEEDLINNLGTIAKSGTKAFLENMTGDQKKDSQLIGQFGVGFYACFMVADKVEVTSKKAGEDQAYLWRSNGTGEFEIENTTQEGHGTTIVLHLKDDESEFLEEYRIESIVKKYSNHIPFAIFMDKEKYIPAVTDDDGKETEPSRTEIENQQINKANALWTIAKKDIKDEEYKDFYSSFAHSSEEPLTWMHNKAEGAIEYTTLFYIPSKAPMDLYRVDYQTGIKLYINRVFITDDEKELMPTYLRFLRGVIDSKDLPLNVSREILQSNAVMAKIKNASVKKVLSELAKMKKDKEKYETFYKEFGNVLKEGLYNDFANREKILELLQFNTLNSDEKVYIEDFVKNVDEDKKEIYYITGKSSVDMLKASPALERFKAKGIDVLILNEEVDTIIFPMVTEYKDYKLMHISDAKFELDEEEKKAEEETAKTYEGLIKQFKEALGDSVKEVETTTDLVDSPVKIKEDKEDPAYMMAQMMKQMGQDAPDAQKPKPILQINPKHELLEKLKDSSDLNLVQDAAHVLLDQAKLFDGQELDDTADFVSRLNRIMSKAV